MYWKVEEKELGIRFFTFYDAQSLAKCSLRKPGQIHEYALVIILLQSFHKLDQIFFGQCTETLIIRLKIIGIV